MFQFLEVTSKIKPGSLNIAIPIGVSLGAVSLIIIAFLAVYLYRRNSNGGHAVENADDIEMQPVLNRNPVAECVQTQVVAAAEGEGTEDIQHLSGEGSPYSLGMIKETDLQV